MKATEIKQFVPMEIEGRKQHNSDQHSLYSDAAVCSLHLSVAGCLHFLTFNVTISNRDSTV